MGRKKDPNKKDRIEDVRENMDRAQQHYLAIMRKKKLLAEIPVEQKVDTREAFRIFWASSKKEYKRSKDLEDVLWAHLKAINHDKAELFEQGLMNFGLKK